MWLVEKLPEMVIKCTELLTIVTTRLGETVFTFQFLNDKIHNYVFLTFTHEISQLRSSTFVSILNKVFEL